MRKVTGSLSAGEFARSILLTSNYLTGLFVRSTYAIRAHEKEQVKEFYDSMVFYEITAVVDADIASHFEAFMSETHIADVLATGYFSNAVFSRNGERYRIRYETDHQSKIDQYLDLKAPLLRSMFLERFPTGVQLSRDSWEVLARFDPPPRR